MAQKLTPSARRRNQDLTNPGVRGRQTGIEVRERERGSDDMEPLDDFFTSPATGRTSRVASTRRSNGTNTSSEAMDIERSPAPDPVDVLSAGRSSGLRGRIPPPGRSPIRTPGLGPAKRGSLPPATSPSHSEALSTQRPTKLQRLDFSKADSSKHATPTIELRDRRSLARSAQSGRSIDAGSISESPERGRDASRSPLLEASRLASEELDGAIEPVSITMEEFEAPAMGDDDPTNPDFALDTTMEEEQEYTTQMVDDDENDNNLRELLAPLSATEANATEHEAEAEEELQPPVKRKRGRPPKDKNIARPQVPPVKRSDIAKKPTRQREAEEKGPRSVREGTPGPLQRAREQTPYDPDAGKQTRSGRVSYKPLAYWKGERAVFNPHTRGQELQQIIRMDEVTPMKRNIQTVKAAQRKRRRAERSQSALEEEQGDEGEEPWELEEAIISGKIKLWNNEEGVVSNEEVDEELAFAANGIEARQVSGAQFLFAKTLTRPFFGTGIVELPAGGFKSWKCSRAFQMVFFVHFGKVIVEIAPSRDSGAETRFTISRGGTWQVPRGNFYAIRNETKYPAKLFFAQGREMTSQDHTHSAAQD